MQNLRLRIFERFQLQEISMFHYLKFLLDNEREKEACTIFVQILSVI